MNSLTVNLDKLRAIFERMNGEEVKKLAQDVIAGKQVAALMGQAIAQNFREEGPGWKPLTNATIRQSVSKTMRKHLIKQGGQLYDGRSGERPRQILYRTGVLYKSATTAAATGNIYRVRDLAIEWGTSLHYAGIHNRGGVINHPGSKNAFGIKGLTTKPHKIYIDARPYLRLSEFWRAQIYSKVAGDFAKALVKLWRGQ